MDQIIRCPRTECNHRLNDHVDHGVAERHPLNGGCQALGCSCQVSPETIAEAAVQTALFGDLTQPPKAQHVRRQPDGSWT